jgi:hypothetical protein
MSRQTGVYLVMEVTGRSGEAVRAPWVVTVALAALILAGCSSSGQSGRPSTEVGPSSSPTTTTAATPTTSPNGSPAKPVAIGFSDPVHGLLLVQSCGSLSCSSWVEITTDGGRYWQPRPPFATYPATDYIKVQGVAVENPTPNPNRFGVDGVVLASASDAWAYGPGLFVTHDGGREFRRISVGAPVLSVVASGGQVWVLEQRCFVVKHPTYSANACDRSVLLTGAANGDTLRPVVDQPPGFALAPGYEPGTQFPLEVVAAGPELGVLAGVFGLDVTNDGGRTWRQDDYPCRSRYVSGGWPGGSVARDPSGSLWLVCAGEPSAGFQPKQLWRSFDDGRTWLGPYELLGAGYADTLDVVSTTEAWAYGARAPILHSTDGGRTWKAMLVNYFNSAFGGPRGFSAIGPDDAWIVAPQSGAPFPTKLFRTTDGGGNWFSGQLRG